MTVRRLDRPALRLDIRNIFAAGLLGLVLVACSNGGRPGSGTGGPTAAPDAVRVVATTTVLADMVRQIGGTRVAVTSLVPPGGEVHTFDPTPSDLAAVADADLVVMNGLGLDEWLAAIIADSGTDATVVELGEDLDEAAYLVGDEHGHEGEAVNPHLWLDVENGIRYAKRIGDALADVDPADADAYAADTAAYVERLETLDRWAGEQIGTIPEVDRRIVSFHEAFPYFAAAYGLEVVGTVVDAPGQDPSAGEIASLVEAIRESGARAVFSEVQFDPELAETVAREAGVAVETNLYNDSLGEPPVDTYEGLIRWDVERVVGALTK
jgi:ABC-type Zn uptake system ZnuABC Zn-binding protein ZnuA